MASYKYKQKFKRAYESFNKRMSKIGEREGVGISEKGYKYKDYITNVSENLSKMTNTQVASAIRSLNSKVRSSLTEMFVSYDVEKDKVVKGIMKAGNIRPGRIPSANALKRDIQRIKYAVYDNFYTIDSSQGYSDDFVSSYREKKKFNEEYDVEAGTTIYTEKYKWGSVIYTVEEDGLHAVSVNKNGEIINDYLTQPFGKKGVELEDDYKARRLLEELQIAQAERKIEEQHKQQVMTDLNSLYLQEMYAYLTKENKDGIVKDILNKITEAQNLYGSSFIGKAVDKYIADNHNVPTIPDSGGTYDDDLIPMLEFFDELYYFIGETPPDEIEAYEGEESWPEIK